MLRTNINDGIQFVQALTRTGGPADTQSSVVDEFRHATRLMARSVPLILLLALSACAHRPVARDFSAGTVKSRLLESYGEPLSVRSLVKDHTPIFGPIESFWDSLHEGDHVEIWSYPVVGGAVELYFVNDSDVAAGVGFDDQEAVY